MTLPQMHNKKNAEHIVSEHAKQLKRKVEIAIKHTASKKIESTPILDEKEEEFVPAL